MGERGKHRRVLVALIAAIGSSCVALGCKTPTEVTIEIASELGHRADMTIAVQLGRQGQVENAVPRVVTTSAWPAGGTVGTVVAVPKDDTEEVLARVVLATGRQPSTCTPQDATGCVIVRRRVRFDSGQSTRTRIVLRPACLGVFCDESTSCAADGKCGPLESDVAFTDGGAPPAVVGDAGDPYANAVLSDRPRHFYRFDEPEGSSTAKDTMGRADGAYDSVKLGVTGALASSTNTGAFFDGRGRVTIPKAEDFPGAMSVEFWARADTLEGARPTIVERIDDLGGTLFGYRVSKPPGSEMAFEVFRGSDSFSALAPSTKFAGYAHFVAAVKAGQLELWQNGVERRSEPLAGALPSSVIGPLIVGASAVGANAFSGAIDELALYDYPLDAEQMKRHIDAARGR